MVVCFSPSSQKPFERKRCFVFIEMQLQNIKAPRGHFSRIKIVVIGRIITDVAQKMFGSTKKTLSTNNLKRPINRKIAMISNF